MMKLKRYMWAAADTFTVLSKSLKELEADGLVLRREYMEVPIRVEYELTEKAKQLHDILEQLVRWTKEFCVRRPIEWSI